MNVQATVDLHSLNQLQSVSAEMLAFAELGDWDAVLACDNKRLQILNKQTDNSFEGTSDPSRKSTIGRILKLDHKIKELASNQRQLAMDEEIRRQAQVAAQTSYKQALTPDTG
ncbi:MAG: flagellar protein FliT [Granulosicoccaceae bacterium]